MDTRSSNFFQRVAIGIICIAVLAYTVFHMVSMFSAELSTIVVGSTTEETVVELDGYIFRDETLIYSNYSGAVDYIAYDGLKLSIGEEIAVVYEQGNHVDVGDGIDSIDSTIDRLERSTDKQLSLSALPDINDAARDTHYLIMKKLASGDIGAISDNIDAMLEETGKVDHLTNNESQLEETLSALYETKAKMMSAGGRSEKISAVKSGYFYSNTDGYESLFTMAATDGLTFDNYRNYISADAALKDTSGAIGKMVYDSEWRLVTTVSKTYAGYFEDGDTYDAIFSGSGDIEMPLTLSKSIKDENTGSLLLIFDCDRMSDGFDFERAQSIELTLERISGINVPKSAVHRSDGLYYVYILKGSVVFERRIDIVHEGSDYYTVRDGMAPDGGDIYLQSNDTLILGGQNLFDGRILD